MGGELIFGFGLGLAVEHGAEVQAQEQRRIEHEHEQFRQQNADWSKKFHEDMDHTFSEQRKMFDRQGQEMKQNRFTGTSYGIEQDGSAQGGVVPGRPTRKPHNQCERYQQEGADEDRILNRLDRSEPKNLPEDTKMNLQSVKEGLVFASQYSLGRGIKNLRELGPEGFAAAINQLDKELKGAGTKMGAKLQEDGSVTFFQRNHDSINDSIQIQADGTIVVVNTKDHNGKTEIDNKDVTPDTSAYRLYGAPYSSQYYDDDKRQEEENKRLEERRKEHAVSESLKNFSSRIQDHIYCGRDL